MINSTSVMTASLILSMAMGSATAGAAKEHTLTLQFTPQETTGSSAPGAFDDMASRPVSLQFEDDRPASEKPVVGEGTDDSDRPFPWRATNSPSDFANEVFVRTAQGWGVRFDQSAPLVLAVRLTRFFVSEKDQAVGSTFAAEVRVAFELRDRSDAVLASGTAGGDARRYGRARSADNCNEVLSDAMKHAYATLFDHPGLKAAWSGRGSAPESKSQGISPAMLLSDVVALKNQGLTSDLIIRYINQQALATPLNAQDLGEWKKAQLPETVIQAALERSAAVKRP